MQLKAQYTLTHLLTAASLARSVYYYQRKVLSKADNNNALKNKIIDIFHRHKGRYGYRRVTQTIKNEGTHVNHKTVQRLMAVLNLKSTVRPKRYKSYRGEMGRVAEDLLKRDFNASKPNQKWVTDVTEFNVKGQKVYLSPIIDLFNREVVSYEVRKSAQLPLVSDMLDEAIKGLLKTEKPLIHSDQGWQYQHKSIQNKLKDNGLKQSMSRKGNCLDNAVAENFFGILKTEMFHNKEFNSADELIKEIHRYIGYYNNERIKLNLNGLSPIAYRHITLLAA